VNYYTPSDFPKNYDDEELNVHQQMDIDEFFGNILDKLENRLKVTNNENLVKYFFQGFQNDTLTFQEGCTHHRTNTNNFYSIQLQIQNKKNIYESLDMLTEGELMNGDNMIFCPKCNKKKPAVKSQNFKTLPRMLIFVLKRFEFNYNTMKKVKINDYYEFPFELDMTKYISEAKKDVDLNKYTLKSVVVHMGNCEGGHYYAFIKNEEEQWYEFNDTQVTPSNISSLKEEAFGGEETFNNNGYKIKAEKNKSAYLLFYEKKFKLIVKILTILKP
jgi:ubiquitin C-terminal hydrolase